MLAAGCQAIPSISRAPTPASGKLRVAVPNASYYQMLGIRLQQIAKRIPPEYQLQIELVPLSLNAKPGEAELDLAPVWEELPSHYAAALNSGAQEVELALVDPITIRMLANRRALHDLTPDLKHEGWFKTDDFWGNVLQTGQVRGKQVAIPLEASVEIFLYDRRLFEENRLPLPQPGWTWDDFLVAAKKLTTRTARWPQWGFLLSASSPSIFSLAWQQGAELIGKGNELIDLTELGTVRALEFLADLVHTYRVAAIPSEPHQATKVPVPPLPTPTPLPPGHPASSKPQVVQVPWQPRPSPLQQAFFDPAVPLGTELAGEHYAMATTFCTDLTSATWWRGTYTAPGELPVGGHRITFGFANLMLGIPRHAPDVRRSLDGLRALLEASDHGAVIPPRQQADDLHEIDRLLGKEEADVLRSAIGTARFLPGDVPLEAVTLIQRECVGPVLRGEKSPTQAAADAQQALRQTLAE